MKKTLRFICGCAVGLNGLLPGGTLAALCFGHTVELFDYTVFAVITTVVSVLAVIAALVTKERTVSKSEGVLLALLPFFAAASWVLYLMRTNSTADAVCMVICFGCAIVLSVRLARPLTLQITGLVLAGLLAIPVGILSVLGPIGGNTVVDTVASPDGTYYAEVVDSDQGALGGSTLVYVHEAKGLDLLVFKAAKTPNRVYMGQWGEYKDMEIYWKDDDSLIINGREYSVND